MRDGRGRSGTARCAAGRLALVGAALAGVAAPPAAAQQVVRVGTVTLQPSAVGAGPCEATVPTREAELEARRRATETAVREIAARELALSSTGGTRTARVVVRRSTGWLGINTVDVSDLRMTPEGRLVRYCAYPVVVSVEPGSPAEKGGLTSGDTIVAYAGRDLLRSGEIALDRLMVPGKTLRVTVRRGGRTLVKPVLIAERPSHTFFRSFPMAGEIVVREDRDGRVQVERRGMFAEGSEATTLRLRAPRPPRELAVSTAPAPPAPPGSPATPVAMEAPSAPYPSMPPLPVVIGYGGPSVVLGAQVVSADDDLREVLRADAVGVLVVRVLPGTPSANAGLRGGDVIVRAAGQQVLTPSALHRVVQRVLDERALVLRVDRAGHEKEVTLRW